MLIEWSHGENSSHKPNILRVCGISSSIFQKAGWLFKQAFPRPFKHSYYALQTCHSYFNKESLIFKTQKIRPIYLRFIGCLLFIMENGRGNPFASGHDASTPSGKGYHFTMDDEYMSERETPVRMGNASNMGFPNRTGGQPVRVESSRSGHHPKPESRPQTSAATNHLTVSNRELFPTSANKIHANLSHIRTVAIHINISPFQTPTGSERKQPERAR